jgi:dynein heavy chain
MLQQSSVGGAGGKSKKEVVLALSVEFATKLPAAFDIELARYKYPVTYLESMNSILHQEMIRFNRLTNVSFELSTHPIFFSKCHLLISVGM